MTTADEVSRYILKHSTPLCNSNCMGLHKEDVPVMNYSGEELPPLFETYNPYQVDCCMETQQYVAGHRIYRRILKTGFPGVENQDFYFLWNFDLRKERRKLEDSLRKDNSKLLKILIQEGI